MHPTACLIQSTSHIYVASHQQAPPAGKILTVPSLVSQELYINPHFRSLKNKRGEHTLRAVHVWYQHFAKDQIDRLRHNISMASSASVQHKISMTRSASSVYVPTLNDSNKTPLTKVNGI
jgi:hypothetical protein